MVSTGGTIADQCIGDVHRCNRGKVRQMGATRLMAQFGTQTWQGVTGAAYVAGSNAAAAPAANAAPFTDGKGLIDYVMTVYKELGAEKGAQIQGVLTEMGLQNVNELRPTEYDAFFAKVEALK